MDYNLELDKVVQKIKKSRAKTVCLQLPEALKPKATEITDKIEKETKAKCIIWIGTCFGACDIPDLSKLKVDLLIHFGHKEFKK
ncbi:MAG: diphthamide synthesis protein [archaeon]|nr:MAG: diphthamide synthesis protein [archaeon]